jgi:hypothetical protein
MHMNHDDQKIAMRGRLTERLTLTGLALRAAVC